MTLTQTFKGLVYRAHDPGWAWAPESGRGAEIHGGRFNPVGMPALYTSINHETAWIEAQQGFPFKPQPQTICAYQVSCDDLVDLTDPSIRSRIGISISDLACPWEMLVARGIEPPSQQIAKDLFDDRRAGIIVRSFAHRATADNVNVVFWRWSKAMPHQVVVIDDHGMLPADGRSWGR